MPRFPNLLIALVLGGVVALPPPAAASHASVPGARSGCPEPAGGHATAQLPAPDLHCIVLRPTPSVANASGQILLRPAETPFGTAVDRDGVHRHRFVAELEGLPDPADLGPYDRYVLWITSPTLAPTIRLGEVGNGRTSVGEAGMNAFLVMISAEGPEPGDERAGPLVLRGQSASMVLRPHDLPYILAEMSAVLDDDRDPHAHHHPAAGDLTVSPAGAVRVHLGHALGSHVIEEGAAASWSPPPMHPSVRMPPQMMLLRPGVEPFLPRGGGEGVEPIPDAAPRREVRLAHGDTLVLEAGPVMRRIGGLELPGYGFNGQIPGPLIRAEQGATVHVRFRNRTPLPSAVHWHGIRLDNPFDGVPGVTQAPVAPGDEFHYELRLPDEGTYWYHPHLREDVMQDLGLAGNLQVRPAAGTDPYGPVDREEYLVLDDHLVGSDGPVPYGREAPTHALMGRFGNVLLVNGRSDWSTSARPGEVVRFHLTNAASTRTWNVSFGGLPMKLVAGDVGKLPRETWVESVVIAPAERWVVEVRFPDADRVPLENRVQALDHLAAVFFQETDTIGVVEVEGSPAPGADARAESFLLLREDAALRAEVDALVDAHRDVGPDRTLVLGLHTRGLPFPLDPLLSWEGVFRPWVEWSGTMPDMDWLVSGAQAEWVLRDPASGAENMEIDWRFRVGDRTVVRLINDRDTLHPMQHPIHVHGQRFLVLAVNGEPNPHPTWKDTVLVPVGAVVDLVVEMSNPGAWMVHCHIAEHLESGMMAVFRVDP
jgi:suppressor of ftsI